MKMKKTKWGPRVLSRYFFIGGARSCTNALAIAEEIFLMGFEFRDEETRTIFFHAGAHAPAHFRKRKSTLKAKILHKNMQQSYAAD